MVANVECVVIDTMQKFILTRKYEHQSTLNIS
jgi:hypothetical protein